ncbi:STAS domain-containing protein [Salsuginibacillus kocurii]|uniref:STAS domain-containing protein n=1 Tax=Salsuginibacillus kocurii TaxID=427078 RepID=UPI0003795DCA|nr:STAS domain-containing protein [Salsuginibacillus kocurii]
MSSKLNHTHNTILLGEHIVEHNEQLANQLLAQTTSVLFYIPPNNEFETPLLTEFLQTLFVSLGKNLTGTEANAPAPCFLVDKFKAFNQQEHDDEEGILSLRKLLSAINLLIWDLLEEWDKEITKQELVLIRKLTEQWLEQIINTLADDYMQTTNRKGASFQDHELSAPIIRIEKNISVCPLVGNVDERRAQSMMETMLETCKRQQVKALIIDLSGLGALDTVIARRIIRIVQSLNIMGVETTITGIRPEFALLYTDEDLALSDFEIKGTVAEALSELRNKE